MSGASFLYTKQMLLLVYNYQNHLGRDYYIREDRVYGKYGWHTLAIPDLERELDTSKQGLSENEVVQRLQKYGPNELEQKDRKSVWSMFIEQFKDFMVVILIIAAIISGLLGEISDAIIILAIVLLNAALGIIQENKAEESLSALKRMSAPHAKVVRDGRPDVIDAKT